MAPEEKLAAKRANEGIKIFATLLNNLAVGTLVAGFLSPIVSGRALSVLGDIALFLCAFVLHLIAQVMLRRFLKSEE